ncbi:DUF3330 domain-containing protein [Escherichia coli]|nr:DUF3330 domain-containing protein [Escherichia coli]EFO2746588.1 DUF3330 domain-containing protein [Escherichia coli]EFO2751272.1 DUF3330 domain-containing protein [Escherichia coli]
MNKTKGCLIANFATVPEIPLDAAFTPEGAEYVEHFCGLDCYERFQARAKAATESDIAPVPGGSQPSD